MTLPLYGTASQSKGFSSNKARSVLRLRSIESNAERHVADFALARTPEEVQRAIVADWPSIFVIADSPIDLPGTFKGRLVAVPPKYDYLADGDIIGFDHVSRKFRTLYRRNSAHNSFLVTERCNNYCLMCSQPPKDVDDRWILSEIKESLPLVDSATRALTFTGGETLSDWEDFIAVLKECRDHLPGTEIQVLTNGRAFADSRKNVIAATRRPPAADSLQPDARASVAAYARSLPNETN
ncbi:4Fe-4S cluster-binding domain-containing protein [Bradyrhizobium canariense]|nr:4Fe-4S cluster-binding domain-containing protein [Bradyrhizobium canariense]